MAPSTTTERYDRQVQRLIDLSVGTTYDAFEDVSWDDPAFAVTPGDPRLEPFAFDPVRATPRFAAMEADERSRFGVERIATNMRIGWQFENLLQQGLLRQALHAPSSDRRFAYLHHEIIEESQHSMMFHEFARRYAPDAVGMFRVDIWIGQRVVNFAARHLPALFWLFVLGGEIPVDVLQRRALRDPDTHLHPLVERIFQIHVEEEARHVSFASTELRRIVPRLGRVRRLALAMVAPVILASMARMMVLPAIPLARRWNLPLLEVVRAARLPASRQLLRDSVARIRSLCQELDLMSPPARALWRAGGLWETPTP